METYTLGYKFRIYPNATQARLIHRTLGCARFVYNHSSLSAATSGTRTASPLATRNPVDCSLTSRSARKLRGCPK